MSKRERRDPQELQEGMAKLRRATSPAVRKALAKRARSIRDRLEERDLVTGVLLTEWREARGISQVELGKRLQRPMEGSQVSFYERGKASPTVWQLLNLIGGLEIPGATDRDRLRTFFSGPNALPQEGANAGGASSGTVDLIVRVVHATLAEQARATRRRS
jgi:transcriptional regulator with XRE-family HTH domain